MSIERRPYQGAEESVDPGEFLRRVARAEPGWSEGLGGPEGVARLTVELQDRLKRQAEEVAGVRAAAIRELLTTRTLADVARALGVSKQAVSKISRGPLRRNLPW